ncbi:Aste57867_16319 [Aphanomyces stellatus]|uniref:Aste57867_16319 protein n=1 Tax=Aphanomyces stellatus TaxID=120398 RepID=A0A485L654_9STRA|nr:hypothetical protein As57867_016262 [Aphanomyces stellatus]VFT93095.1 Aste57867_16319 [Aphanomyces stellatus]
MVTEARWWRQPPTSTTSHVQDGPMSVAEHRPLLNKLQTNSATDYHRFEDDGLADTRDQHIAKYLFMVLGFGYLFPYCALAQPVDYWHLLFPTFNVDFEISWAYNITSVTTLFLIVWLGGKQWYAGRIVGGFATQVLVLLVLPASYFVLTSQTQHLVVVLGCTIVVSIATSFLDSSVFALANLFPHGGIENVQLGMGFSMVVTSFYRLVTKAFFSNNMVVPATMLYFGVGAATVACGIAAFYLLMRLPLTQRCLARTPQDVVRLALVSKIRRQELMVTLSYALTLSIWPGVITVVPSYDVPHLNASGWWPLVLMAIYSVAEVTGRYLVRFRCGITPQTMWRWVVPRFVLLPLLICSAKGVSGFTHDAISIILIILTAISSGYVGTHAILVVNDIVDEDEQSATGMLSSFFLNIGLIIGATIGLVVAQALDM